MNRLGARLPAWPIAASAIEPQVRKAGAAGRPDRHVFDELETLYRARGDTARTDHDAKRRKALEP